MQVVTTCWDGLCASCFPDELLWECHGIAQDTTCGRSCMQRLISCKRGQNIQRSAFQQLKLPDSNPSGILENANLSRWYVYYMKVVRSAKNIGSSFPACTCDRGHVQDLRCSGTCTETWPLPEAGKSRQAGLASYQPGLETTGDPSCLAQDNAHPAVCTGIVAS